ncbi:glycosyltransferase family 2 protein [Flavobacterium selenitireducens]|uniref:glycosyltransferase family 2 protein n=1 Tax=Flavobacterium selenitireducens TaxID=2722704 RepID=UPI00168B62A4|nr:glycosyltransferase family 2 protein [Flavobacterium selenitireducens]MBD3582556.1 glycosyltransferase family 2 protein [Flavobacterium selenitireducens]
MQLSVVILNYNVRYFLELCLASVQKAIAGIDAEIIVVDNNSPDDSCEMVKALFPTVTLIENKENAGFPKGNNVGVSVARGEFICILNPDTVVAEDTFAKILAFAESKSNLGIVGCRLIDGTGNFLPESKRGVPTPFTAFGKVTSLYKVFPTVFGKYYAPHLAENQSGEVDILVGAFMVMKRADYLSLGGFDENCFMYSDDIDLSYTMLKSGKRNFYCADTTVIHFKGESTVRDGLYMRRFREAMNFFYRKHFRVSPIFDLFMKAGALLFSFKKKVDAKSDMTKPELSCAVPNLPQTLEKTQKLLGKNGFPECEADEKKLNSSQSKRIRFWLDAEEMSFADLIAFMQSRSKPGNTFRIMLKNAAVGSDSSNDRGEILTF